MNFEIAETQILPDCSKRLFIEIAKQDLLIFAYILESFEGFCNLTTVRRGETNETVKLNSNLKLKNKNLLLPKKGGILAQIDIPPDFVNQVEHLLEFLSKWQSL